MVKEYVLSYRDQDTYSTLYLDDIGSVMDFIESSDVAEYGIYKLIEYRCYDDDVRSDD